jgi:uncharacterized cupredoxin-like copper-binding protein
MRRLIVGSLAAAIAVSAGASAQASRLPATSHASALLARVKVTATEFRFVLSAKSAKRGVVIFNVTNKGKLMHDFEISGRKSKMISPGKSTTLRVAFLRKGHYPYKCTVPGHASAGMKGVFIIT